MKNHVQLQNVLTKLASLPAGPLEVDVADEVKSAIRLIWDDLDGSSDTKMQAYKLERAENLRKENSRLYFDIERHGAAAMGSSC